MARGDSVDQGKNRVGAAFSAAQIGGKGCKPMVGRLPGGVARADGPLRFARAWSGARVARGRRPPGGRRRNRVGRDHLWRAGRPLNHGWMQADVKHRVPGGLTRQMLWPQRGDGQNGGVRVWLWHRQKRDEVQRGRIVLSFGKAEGNVQPQVDGWAARRPLTCAAHGVFPLRCGLLCVRPPLCISGAAPTGRSVPGAA